MNKVILIGRITKDIDLKYTESNKAVASFTLAIDRTFGEKKETDFINCCIWGKQAENLKKYCGKGSQIAVDGRIQTRNYDDKDGKKVYVTEVVAENIQFLDNKKDNQEVGQDIPQPSQPSQQEEDPFQSFAEQMKITDDDLPF
jgi:single-strand DNA-binding protein